MTGLPAAPGSGARRLVWTVVGLIAVYNLVGNLLLPAWAYVPANLAALAVIGAVARLSAPEMGLRRDRVGAGLRLGLKAALAIVVVLVVVAVIPLTRELLSDDRLRGVGLVGLAYHTLLRIPVGTAVFEEVLFRGVLFGALARMASRNAALVASSALFGLWHVLPTLDALETNAAGDVAESGLGLVGAVVGSVVVTALAGAAFAWLRERADSLVAPVVAHAALNSTAYAIGWLLVDRGWA